MSSCMRNIGFGFCVCVCVLLCQAGVSQVLCLFCIKRQEVLASSTDLEVQHPWPELWLRHLIPFI